MFRTHFKRLSRFTFIRVPHICALSLSLLLLNDQRQRMSTSCLVRSRTLGNSMIFSSIVEKNQGSMVIIYSRQTHRPIGAGVIVHSNGTFITVSEIVSDAEGPGRMYARFYHGQQDISFQLVMSLPQERLAICKLEGHQLSNLQPVQLGEQTIGQQLYCLSKDHNDMNIFDSTIVLGNNFTVNPQHFDENALNAYSPFIIMNQTVPMLPGTPVFNEEGGLTGLIRRDDHFSDKQIAVTSGFLLPIINQLNNNTVKRAFIGLSVKTSENGGAFIIKINTDGPAEQAGLRLGEIIKSINGYPIKHAADVCKILGFQVEQKVELLIDRDGKQRTVIVTTL